MNRNMSRQKRTLIVLLIAAALIALAAVFLLLSSRLERMHDAAPEGAGLALSRSSADEVDARLTETGVSEENDSVEIATLFYNGQQYIYKERLTSLLILGIDDAELLESATARNQSQADFLLLAVFDPDSRECTLIQLNRDTMCDVPVLDADGNYVGLVNEQLALSHTYGNGMESSCENTVFAVSRLLYGVEISNYFALTMDAIPVLNDLVGGVTVTIEDDFSAVDPTLVMGETVTLTAENVEHFVRERWGIEEEPTNLNRMMRQRAYMYGLVEGLKEAVADDSSFVLAAYSAISKSLVTDCSIEELFDYADRFSGYTLREIVSPEGEAVLGEKFMEFYADEEDLQRLVLETFYAPVTEG